MKLLYTHYIWRVKPLGDAIAPGHIVKGDPFAVKPETLCGVDFGDNYSVCVMYYCDLPLCEKCKEMRGRG